MQLASVPRTAPGAAAPSLPPGFLGVAIVAARVPAQEDLVQVDGRFCIPVADAEAIGRPLHRALAGCVWGEGFHDSVDPFRDVVLFPEDETDAGGAISGGFSFSFAMYRGPGLYLHVALGEHLSDSIPCPP